MKSFLYRAFWKGKQKWLISVSIAALIFWLSAYFLFYYFVPFRCSSNQDCFDFWLHTISRPFYSGAFLKVVVIAPILLLPFSNVVFKTWLVFSVFVLPYAVYQIVTAPTHAMFFDKVATSGVWGLAYLMGTVAIIVFVSIGEWAYKQYKKK